MLSCWSLCEERWCRAESRELAEATAESMPMGAAELTEQWLADGLVDMAAQVRSEFSQEAHSPQTLSSEHSPPINTKMFHLSGLLHRSKVLSCPLKKSGLRWTTDYILPSCLGMTLKHQISGHARLHMPAMVLQLLHPRASSCSPESCHGKQKQSCIFLTSIQYRRNVSELSLLSSKLEPDEGTCLCPNLLMVAPSAPVPS